MCIPQGASVYSSLVSGKLRNKNVFRKPRANGWALVRKILHPIGKMWDERAAFSIFFPQQKFSKLSIIDIELDFSRQFDSENDKKDFFQNDEMS